MCHFVGEEVSSSAFEEAMRWCSWSLMEAGYCVLAHARLCSIQRLLPHRMCAQMQDEAHMRVNDCIGLGSCSALHCEGAGES